MEEIHAPTTNGNTHTLPTKVPSTREELLALIDQKDLLEAELRTLGAVLDSHHVTMTTPLTTFDGYPRDDIDVAQSTVLLTSPPLPSCVTLNKPN